MVRAGEESGDLSSSLKLTADNLERTHTLKKKIKGAMFYPTIVLVVIVGIGALMMIYVVPTLTSTFKELNMKLPLSTRSIIFFSELLKNNLHDCGLSSVIVTLKSGVVSVVYASSTGL